MKSFLSQNISLNNALTAGGIALAAATTLYIGKKVIPALLHHEGKQVESVIFDDAQHGGLLVAYVLKNHGVKHLFVLSGGHISPVMVGAKQIGIKVVDVRNEVNAVFAADAVSRVTGNPGVACVTAGPGLTNTITAVKNAQVAQSPLILLGGASSDLLKGRGALQDIDQQALLAPHVKWMAHVGTVADIVPMLEKAFQIAQSGTPGPVFLELPIDVLYPEKTTRKWYATKMGKKSLADKIVSWYMSRHLNGIFKVSRKKISLHEPFPLEYPIAHKAQINKVVETLRHARKPVLVLGSQVVTLPALEHDKKNVHTVQQAVLSLGLPTYMSSMARGLVGRDDAIGLKQHSRSFALKHADVVLLAGVVQDFRLDYGRSISSSAHLIGVNRDKVDLKKNRSPDHAILSDPATFLHLLAEALPVALPAQWATWLDELKEIDRKRDEDIAKLGEQEIQPMHPIKVCQQIEAVMGENSIIVADGGDFVATASKIIKPRAPLSWLDPGPFGTLGVGGGFALGAKLSRPDSEVWIIFGDGACGYSIAEFDTYVRHNVPIIAVVGNDAAWQQILREQVETFKDDVGCALEFTDYNVVAIGYGGEGLKVSNHDELLPALQKAKEFARSGRPVLVNCLIGKCDFRAGAISV